MARAIWSGAISFGLVNVPVKLYTRHVAQVGPLPPALGQDGRAHQAEARGRQHGRGGGLRGHRQGLRAHARPLRDRSSPTSSTRSIPRPPTRSTSRSSSIWSRSTRSIYDHNYYLAPDRRRCQGLPPAARRDARVGQDRRRALRPALQAAALRAAPDRRRARAHHDAVRRRGALARSSRRARLARARPRPPSASCAWPSS